MSSLLLSLDDTDFEALFQSARSVIPAVAPEWTDHNLHDPGITLIDLLAWSADQQIYALGHQRLDERLGYAALLGLRPQGPVPARGRIWAPSGVELLPTGISLPAGTEISPLRSEAPRFAATHDVYLTPARLTALRTITASGERIDWPTEPARGSVLLPFGTDPARGARLELTLDGVLISRPRDRERPFLSIGFRTEEKPQDGPEPAEPRQGRLRARLRAELETGGRVLRLPIVHDQTAGFTRSGVILVELPPDPWPPSPLPSSATLRLILRSGRLPVPPRSAAVGINVVPIRQQREQKVPGPNDPPVLSTGLPDQQFQLDARRTRFGKGVAAPKVTVERGGQAQEWTLCSDLSAAGPDDEMFAFDTESAVIRFGNGVNGKIPPAGADLGVSCLACDGSGGNLPAGLRWTVPGTRVEFGNPEPMRGGADWVDVTELRRQARRRVQTDRPLVTDADLEAAARACADLRVARAHVLAQFDPQRRHGHAGVTRSLVVVRADSGKNAGAETETAAWLRALRRRLAPHLPLGDRVRIVGPRYIELRLRAVLIVAPNRNAAAIREKARCLLESRLAPAAAPGEPVWPLGRDVEPHDLMGFLRGIDGVVAVRELRIGSRASRLGSAAMEIPPHGLPRLLEPNDIVVEPARGGGP